MKKILGLIAAITMITITAGCTDTAASNDKKVTDQQLQKYQQVQPVPQYDWSQYRQTVIDVQNAQANAVLTTSFMFNMGTADPIDSCPSIGFPVPTTAQLTSPDHYVSSGGVVSQAEPNGAYTGDSSGTYIVCVASDGTKYIDYWEGSVKTTGGPAHWDYDKHKVILDGKPTVTTTTQK